MSNEQADTSDRKTKYAKKKLSPRQPPSRREILDYIKYKNKYAIFFRINPVIDDIYYGKKKLEGAICFLKNKGKYKKYISGVYLYDNNELYKGFATLNILSKDYILDRKSFYKEIYHEFKRYYVWGDYYLDPFTCYQIFSLRPEINNLQKNLTVQLHTKTSFILSNVFVKIQYLQITMFILYGADKEWMNVTDYSFNDNMDGYDEHIKYVNDKSKNHIDIIDKITLKKLNALV